MKINYKLVLSCVLFMITPFRTMATEYLTIEFKDKSFVTFGMDKQPVISFKDGNLVITDNSNETKEMVTNQVVRYYFSKQKITANIEEERTVAQKPIVLNGHVMYQGLTSSSVVRVFTLNGVEVAHYKADSQGCVDIDISTMPHGVYIFHSNKNVIKIVNK